MRKCFHALVSLAALAGPIHAGEMIFTWQVNAFDIVTGDIVATSVSQIEPGQGAELVGSWSFTPEIGTVVTTHNNVTGPVASFARISGDLNASPGHRGTFAQATSSSFLLWHAGTVEPDRLRRVELSYSIGLGGPPAWPYNAMQDAFLIRWTPQDWETRAVEFDFVKSIDRSYAAELYIALHHPPYPVMYATYRIPNENFHGGSMHIQVIPVPASALLLGLGACACIRRRR